MSGQKKRNLERTTKGVPISPVNTQGSSSRELRAGADRRGDHSRNNSAASSSSTGRPRSDSGNNAPPTKMSEGKGKGKARVEISEGASTSSESISKANLLVQFMSRRTATKMLKETISETL
jgi:hypothetical protein